MSESGVNGDEFRRELPSAGSLNRLSAANRQSLTLEWKFCKLSSDVAPVPVSCQRYPANCC